MTQTNPFLAIIDSIETNLEYERDQLHATRCLLTPSIAQHYAIKFFLGRDRVAIYGQPIVMLAMARRITLPISNNHFRPNMKMSERHYRSFIYVWGAINHTIFQLDANWYGTSIIDYYHIIDWLIYFKVPRDYPVWSYIISDLWSVIAKITHEDYKLDDADRVCLEKLYHFMIEQDENDIYRVDLDHILDKKIEKNILERLPLGRVVYYAILLQNDKKVLEEYHLDMLLAWHDFLTLQYSAGTIEEGRPATKSEILQIANSIYRLNDIIARDKKLRQPAETNTESKIVPEGKDKSTVSGELGTHVVASDGAAVASSCTQQSPILVSDISRICREVSGLPETILRQEKTGKKKKKKKAVTKGKDKHASFGKYDEIIFKIEKKDVIDIYDAVRLQSISTVIQTLITTEKFTREQLKELEHYTVRIKNLFARSMVRGEEPFPAVPGTAEILTRLASDIRELSS